MIKTDIWKIESRGNFEVIILTDRVIDFVRASGCQEGYVYLFYRHTTGSIIVAESEVGALVDIQDTLEHVIAKDYPFRHHIRGVDKNGQAHVWSALLSPSAGVTVPFSHGKIMLGEFQDVIMIDMQNEAKPREVFVQLVGET
jgi:secondary thiamine-phosphate synthase enzyme